MTEQHLRNEVIEFLAEQDYYFSGKILPTKVLCLIAAPKPKPKVKYKPDYPYGFYCKYWTEKILTDLNKK